MNAAKTDRRTDRTRALLMTAFVDLVLSDGYDAVTVEHIAERANVGRSTFYLHYTGKEAILKQSLTRPSSFLAILVGHDASPEMLIGILNHFSEQRKTNRVFFTWPVRPIWVRCLAEMIEPRLALVVRHTRARPALPLPLIALQIAEAQIGLIVGWITGKPGVKPDAVAEALIAATRASVAALLRVPGDVAPVIPGEKLRVLHDAR
jgi:AcrR family transcriptional regulator